ncbi:diacylglycerol kinase, partial [Gordonia sp. VNK21]
AIVVEHVTRLRSDLRPDWPRPHHGEGAYRVEITGEPSYVVDVTPSSARGDHNHAAIAAGVSRVVNAIPAVRRAEPGIRTTLDMPLITGPGLTAPH